MKNITKVILQAMASELESAQLYRHMKKNTANFILKERLEYLAGEEDGHFKILDNLLKNLNDDSYDIEKAQAELKNTRLTINEDTPLSDLFQMAMSFEEDSERFYHEQMGKYDDKALDDLFYYLETLEAIHYITVKKEYEFHRDNETFEQNNPYMNIGP